MQQAGEERVEAFSSPLGTAGQVDNETLAPHTGDPTGEHGVRGPVAPVTTEGLGDAWHRTLDDLRRCLRRHIPGTETGAAARKHEPYSLLIGQLAQPGGDPLALVRQNLVDGDPDRLGFEKLLDDPAGFVLAGAGIGGIGDHQHRGRKRFREGIGEIALAAPLFHHPDIAQRQGGIEGFQHVVGVEQGGSHAGERLHFDAGLPDRPRLANHPHGVAAPFAGNFHPVERDRVAKNDEVARSLGGRDAGGTSHLNHISLGYPPVEDTVDGGGRAPQETFRPGVPQAMRFWTDVDHTHSQIAISRHRWPRMAWPAP